ncbi:magnesium ion transmembrane transporter [Malassezia pachydermatis]|uniref:Domain membrane protein n=1 Tax=Malassezia pachydermatis TaxID=77020 RepID=A0A0M8MHM7_9BASI|nr:domain membrane protein [Malassezia pachydermatis]KOS12646.1 domain membrane protein [Malassezia pachydermatis]
MDVWVAVGIGLIASFIQSLGLTLQRRSHLQNERLPAEERCSEWRRPLWVTGFVVFLGANISGTLFQIGSLPVVILAPLGAVSLLYNAFLARIMLNDLLSQHMLTGTCLIAAGAIAIGYFGTVPHAPRSLEDLIALYHRPAFVALALLFSLVFISLLTMAHLTEWQLTWQPPADVHKSFVRRRYRTGFRRFLTVPSLATVAEVSENSSGIATPFATSNIDDRVHRFSEGDINAVKKMHGTLPSDPRVSKPIHYGAISRSQSRRLSSPSVTEETEPSQAGSSTDPMASRTALDMPAHRPTVLALAVIYSSVSGTLSGVCLLMAKSGVDLLILSLQGHNQFRSWGSWSLVILMLLAALLQLWYLHKSVKLADPVLVAPLAFCFYNISSITLGLVYFDDVAQLSWTSMFMVMLGTMVLLCGVWVISLDRSGPDTTEEDATFWGPGWQDPISYDATNSPPCIDVEQQETVTSPESTSSSGSSHLPPLVLPSTPRRPTSGPSTPTSKPRSLSISLDHALTEGMHTTDHAHMKSTHQPTLYGILVERGLSIGISPSSPGFHVHARRRVSSPLSPSEQHDSPSLA